MSETPAARLQLARTRAGFSNASEAARHFGWNENTYRSHENGERGVGRAALKYAIAFKVALGWLIAGAHDKSGLLVNIDGVVKNKGRIAYIPQDEIDQIIRALLEDVTLPFKPETEDFDVYLFGVDFSSRYDFCDLIVCWPEQNYKDSDRTDGIIFLENRRERFLQIVERDALKRAVLTHSAPLEALDRAVFKPVKAVVRSGQYRTRRDQIIDGVDWVASDD